MPKGISFHIGVQSPIASMGFPDLRGCNNDAMAMAEIARSCGFQGREVLTGSQATARTVLDRIEAAAQASQNPGYRIDFGSPQATEFLWSGRGDLNARPPAPKAGALPGCATPRHAFILY